MTPGSAHGSYELALHPGAQERIAEEVHATLAGRAAFEYDDLKQLKYTEMVLKEVRARTLHARLTQSQESITDPWLCRVHACTR